MISLTNNTSQELNPGQSLTFNLVLLHTGKSECYQPNTGAIMLKRLNAIYDIDFSANIGAIAPGVASIVMTLNGSPMPETTMISQTAAAGDVNNVAKSTSISTMCGCGPVTVTIENNGEAAVVVENPLLKTKRIA